MDLSSLHKFATKLAFPALRFLPPELAHSLSVQSLKLFNGTGKTRAADMRLGQRLLSLDFPNPIGLAAGFDKNGEVYNASLSLGFGFVEVGTITPVSQPGNPRPRVFRLPEDRAIINRYGFNNRGSQQLIDRLSKLPPSGILGINVGANKATLNKIDDYVSGVKSFAPFADYLTINVSSPNTADLRSLQHGSVFDELLARTQDAANQVAVESSRVPMLIKIAPDMTEAELDEIANTVGRYDIDGLIVSNTTIGRAGLSNSVIGKEAGGLSGQPLFHKSTIVLAKMRERVGMDKIIIGAGGVSDGLTAVEKLRAGANLVQVYSALTFRGPALLTEIEKTILSNLEMEKLDNVSELVGCKMADWANQSLDA